MTVLVECPECKGAGEVEDCQASRGFRCSHTNHRVWKCGLCRGTGEVTPERAVQS